MPNLSPSIHTYLADNKLKVVWKQDACGGTKTLLACAMGRSDAIKRIVLVSGDNIELTHPTKGSATLKLPASRRLLEERYLLLSTKTVLQQIDLQDGSVQAQVTNAKWGSNAELVGLDVDPSGGHALVGYCQEEEPWIDDVQLIRDGKATPIDCEDLCDIEVDPTDSGAFIFGEGGLSFRHLNGSQYAHAHAELDLDAATITLKE